MNRTIIIVSASFALGAGLGYSTFPAEQKTTSALNPSSRHRQASGPRASGNESSTRASSSTGRRDARHSIKTDLSGNYILPATMVDRLACSALDGINANRPDLQVLGLSDEQIDQVQQLVDQTLQRCFDREKSVIQDFTKSDDELVRMIPGNPTAAAADKQRLIDAIQLMGGTKTALLEKELVEALARITMEFGAEDSFFRASRREGSENSESQLVFERIQLFLRPGESAPSPGSSFMGYQKKYQFSSTCRFGGKTPPDYAAHLLLDGQWEHLLQPKSERQ